MGSECCDNESEFGFWILGLTVTHFNSMNLQGEVLSRKCMVATSFHGLLLGG